MKQQGFTLVECLVAISLLTLLALLMTHFAIRSYISLHLLRTQIDRYMMLHTAFDIMLYDVYRAPELKKWSTVKDNDYAWKHNKDTIRWYLDGDRLMRSKLNKTDLVATAIASFVIKEANIGYSVSLSSKEKNGINNHFEQVVRVIR